MSEQAPTPEGKGRPSQANSDWAFALVVLILLSVVITFVVTSKYYRHEMVKRGAARWSVTDRGRAHFTMTEVP